ncbi:MAG: type II toxin-antitoxin system VapC family toxin [Nitrososphaerota archaeon]
MRDELLFDASSLLCLLKLRKLGPLNNNYIQWLTIYEAANALWKEASLIGSISPEDAYEMIKILSDCVDVVKILSPHPYEYEILATASKLKITAYDASYVVLADKNNLVLVTEDSELREKAKSLIEAISVSDITRRRQA